MPRRTTAGVSVVAESDSRPGQLPRLEDDYYAIERLGMLNGHVYPLGRIMEDLTALH